MAVAETASERERRKQASLSPKSLSLSPAHAATVSKVKGGRRERRVLIRSRLLAEWMWVKWSLSYLIIPAHLSCLKNIVSVGNTSLSEDIS